jgi:hypothetical protein
MPADILQFHPRASVSSHGSVAISACTLPSFGVHTPRFGVRTPQFGVRTPQFGRPRAHRGGIFRHLSNKTTTVPPNLHTNR